MYVCVYTYIYIYTCIHIYIYIYIYIYDTTAANARRDLDTRAVALRQICHPASCSLEGTKRDTSVNMQLCHFSQSLRIGSKSSHRCRTAVQAHATIQT